MIDEVGLTSPNRENEELIAQLSVVDKMLLPAVIKYGRMGFVDGRRRSRSFSGMPNAVPVQGARQMRRHLLPLRRQPTESRAVEVDDDAAEGLHLR